MVMEEVCKYKEVVIEIYRHKEEEKVIETMMEERRKLVEIYKCKGEEVIVMVGEEM